MMNAGEKVREFRAKKGMTQGDFAKYAGISTPTVQKIEKGIDVSLLIASKIAKALGVEFQSL